MAKKQTTNEQWELILEHMNNNPNLARGVPVFGSNRKEIDDSWEQLTQKVNAIGPPQRESKEWKKVWCDLRTRLKKKLSENKVRASRTGGGINTQIPLTQVWNKLLTLF
ncbi:nuclear apoptosis-inducing factor 1-like [Lucilia cuprina]|uniref:nuclear apoptosis-inducing factor 1-like n=1 Tax=Lucilia cuprina TaxID=7375 RepID=UPI001F05CA79|nr:nuclear apoptosis-inducing factor 1-like [Lucilia cuprina]